MGLITETNAQYYSGQQVFTQPNPVVTQVFNWTGDTNLVVALAGVSNANFKVLKNNDELTFPTEYTVVGNSITLVNAGVSVSGDVITIQLLKFAINNNHGSYEYISLNDIINNFMVAYIGVGKLIPNVKRTDIMFHAKRGLQEFSYDTLKSIKSQELTIPPSLSLIIPQDYVNYVNLSWVDQGGVKHIIYPTTLTSNPTELPLQDTAGVPTQDAQGENNLAEQSKTETRWASNNSLDLTGEITNEVFENANVYGFGFDRLAYGQRYGLEPEVSQKNGWFTINERTGSFNFSSDLANKLIILEYISDGLSVDADTRIPKMAEEAMYMHIAYSILSGRANIPEYVVRRFKKDKSSTLRNAKIRLSNIKLEEFTQVMRGKSKWIKH
tara:strand:- start:1104 stop:2252 length:1149 start_codon:yes stop_codon:yes gene_type:complete